MNFLFRANSNFLSPTSGAIASSAFVVAVVLQFAVTSAWSATISVDSANNPNGDGTALFQLGEELDPSTTVIFNPLPTTSTPSGLIALSELRTIAVSGTRYVQLAFDMNEPGNDAGDDWEITTFSLSVGGTTVYQLNIADQVVFNPTGSVVDANNGGGDIDGYVLIPESLFQGQGFALTDTFGVTASFGQLGAAADRLIVGPGDGTPLSLVPEPSTALLVGLALFASRLRRRR